MNRRNLNPYFVVGLILIFPFIVSAQGQLTEIDLDVNGIRSGSTYQTVLKKLGQPISRTRTRGKASESCTGKAITLLTLKYPGLEVSLVGDGSGQHMVVHAMEITQKNWIGSGAKIGETMASIKKRFGKPNSIYERSGEKILYYVTKGNLGNVNFHFRNGKLKRFLMSEALC